MIRYEPFTRSHLSGTVELCADLDWPSYAEDAETTWAALTSPGSTTLVALESGSIEGDSSNDDAVVGFANLLSDGQIHAHLSLVGVHPSHRRRGIARTLLERIFASVQAKWIDLVSEEGSEEFYRSFTHQERSGFRIYPNQPQD